MNEKSPSACPAERFVSQDLCKTINAQHRDSFRLLFEELRGLRRLFIALIIGGQLFASGAGFFSTHYWLSHRQSELKAACVDRETIEQDFSTHARCPKNQTLKHKEQPDEQEH